MSPWQLVPERPIEPAAPVYCRRTGRLVNLIKIDAAWIPLLRDELPVALPARRPVPRSRPEDALARPDSVERFDFFLYPLRIPNDTREHDAYIFFTDDPEAAATMPPATVTPAMIEAWRQ